MIFFGIIILIAWAIIIGLNVLFNTINLKVMEIILMVLISTLAVIAIDGITATCVRLLPKKWFSPEHNFFKVYKWEKNFYQKLGIKKWKDWVPEIGHFTGFRKNKVAEPNNIEYLHRFLLEINYGRVGHFLSFITGFLIVFIFPLKFALRIGIPVALVNILMNSLSWIILRYNYPKIMALYTRNKRPEHNKK